MDFYVCVRLCLSHGMGPKGIVGGRWVPAQRHHLVMEAGASRLELNVSWVWPHGDYDGHERGRQWEERAQAC